MEPSYKENGFLAKELEDELMKFTKSENDLEVDAKLSEQPGEMQRCTEAEISITECTKSLGNKLFEGEYQDTTESSSSFDGSDCGTKNVDTFDDSGSSDFCDEALSALDYDGLRAKLIKRRKKLTIHWRSFIQPLMWRCKWIELQIKKLQSQAQQYDRELEMYNKQKETQWDDITLDDGVKSHPFSHVNARCSIMKRKKRRISEATTDVAAYMSHHSLFSYYENKKGFSERPFLSNESKNPATHKVFNDDDINGDDDLLSLEAGNGDSSFEHLLSKIHDLHSQVGTLKSRIDWVMSECNCTSDLAMPCSASTSNSGDGMPVGTYIASQLISEYNMGSVCDSAVTSRGDVGPQASGSTCFANAYGNVEDGVLIDNQRVKEEMNTFEEVKIPQVERTLVLKDNGIKEEVHSSQEVKIHIHPIRSPSVLGDDGSGNRAELAPAETDMPVDEKPASRTGSLAKLSAPKSRKKWGRRKGAGRWSRRPKG